MKKLAMLLGVLALMVAFSASQTGAALFTMNPTQLQSLYETFENPDHVGTYLYPVQAIEGGAKYTGNVRTSDPGWGQIQIGANFWGTPHGGSPGDKPSNVALGMGSLSGYDSYGLIIENVNENDWMFNLYFNVGWTDPPFNETNYYAQNTWTTIGAGETKTIILDFTNCQVWGGDYSGEWIDLTSLDINWDHITNIGLNIGGNVPVGPDDYTFEVKVRPVPEPSSLLLLGSGLLGFGAYFRARFGRKKKN